MTEAVDRIIKKYEEGKEEEDYEIEDEEDEDVDSDEEYPHD